MVSLFLIYPGDRFEGKVYIALSLNASSKNVTERMKSFSWFAGS